MRFRTLLMLILALTIMACSPTALPLYAQGETVDTTVVAPADDSFDFMRDLGRPAILSIVFTLIGLVLFAVCIWLIVRVTPFSVQKEIEEDQNTALGIIMGAMILGIAIILAAALLG